MGGRSTAAQSDQNAYREGGTDADERTLIGKIPGDTYDIDKPAFGAIIVYAAFLLKVVGEITQLAADFIDVAAGRTAEIVNRIRGGLGEARDIPPSGGKQRA